MKCPFAALVTFVAVFLLSEPVYSSPVCLESGVTYQQNDLTFDQLDVNHTLVKKARSIGPIDFPREPVANPSIFGSSSVEFEGEKILLNAFAFRPGSVPGVLRSIEAFARGNLFFEFIVDCDHTENEEVAVEISFRVLRSGRLTTFLPGSRVNTTLSADVRDVAVNQQRISRLIENTSVGNLLGKFKFIIKLPVIVPLPVPETEAVVELAPLETLAVTLVKGRVYRFNLIAAARSTSGLLGTEGYAIADFRQTLIDDLGLNENGIELVDFRIRVAATDQDEGADIEELKMTVSSLQEALVSLSAQLENIEPSIRVHLSELESLVAEQDENVETLRMDIEAEINGFREDFDDHAHEYLTGKGNGHNNTSVTTSTPGGSVQ